MSDCIFCKIVAGDIPANIVWQDENILAFRDIQPKAPVHVLLVPKKHVVTFDQLDGQWADTMVSMATAAREVSKIEGVLETGYRLLINNGADAHQEVAHLHMHLFGGRELGPMIKKAPQEG